MTRNRFWVNTGYHFWQVMDRDIETAVSNFSARGKGDKRARSEAHAYADGLNDGIAATPLARSYITLHENTQYQYAYRIGLATHLSV